MRMVYKFCNLFSSDMRARRTWWSSVRPRSAALENRWWRRWRLSTPGKYPNIILSAICCHFYKLQFLSPAPSAVNFSKWIFHISKPSATCGKFFRLNILMLSAICCHCFQLDISKPLFFLSGLKEAGFFTSCIGRRCASTWSTLFSSWSISRRSTWWTVSLRTSPFFRWAKIIQLEGSAGDTTSHGEPVKIWQNCGGVFSFLFIQNKTAKNLFHILN